MRIECPFNSHSLQSALNPFWMRIKFEKAGLIRLARTAHWMRIESMCIQCASIASALQTRKTKPNRMRIEPIHPWRWIESGLEWNMLAFASLPACLQFHPTSATTQMLTVNVRGLVKDTPTSCSYHVIRRGHPHISLSQPTLQSHSAEAVKSGLKPVPSNAHSI